MLLTGCLSPPFRVGPDAQLWVLQASVSLVLYVRVVEAQETSPIVLIAFDVLGRGSQDVRVVEPHCHHILSEDFL